MEIGKVIEYNGFAGYIKGIDGKKYLLTNDNINKYVESLKKGDNVSFIPEEYSTIEISENIARDIRVLTKDNYNNMKKKQ